jgi:hypothetical protein
VIETTAAIEVTKPALAKKRACVKRGHADAAAKKAAKTACDKRPDVLKKKRLKQKEKRQLAHAAKQQEVTKFETRISNSTEARPEIFSSPIHFHACAVAAPTFTHKPFPCGGGVGGWVVLCGRRKNKKEGGKLIEEEIERTKKK